MKLPLKIDHRDRRRDDIAGYLCVDWHRCVPFFINPRGVLVHRIRYARSHAWHGKFSHHSVTYFCGNIGRATGASAFVDAPPPDRLLCVFCEAKAVAAGLPTADALAGRHVHIGHVHIGRARVERVCCREQTERN